MAALAVLADHALLHAITSWMRGVSLAVAAYERAQSFYALAAVDGNLPRLAIVQNDTRMLALLHRAAQSMAPPPQSSSSPTPVRARPRPRHRMLKRYADALGRPRPLWLEFESMPSCNPRCRTLYDRQRWRWLQSGSLSIKLSFANCYEEAFASQQFEIVQWLVTHRVAPVPREIVSDAVRCAQFGLAKWLVATLPGPFEVHAACVLRALRADPSGVSLASVAWLCERFPAAVVSVDVVEQLAHLGRLGILLWLHDRIITCRRHCSGGDDSDGGGVQSDAESTAATTTPLAARLPGVAPATYDDVLACLHACYPDMCSAVDAAR